MRRDFCFYANKKRKMSGNIKPANANFQPRFLKVNFPAGIMIAPVTAMTIKESPKMSP